MVLETLGKLQKYNESIFTNIHMKTMVADTGHRCLGIGADTWVLGADTWALALVLVADA